MGPALRRNHVISRSLAHFLSPMDISFSRPRIIFSFSSFSSSSFCRGWLVGWFILIRFFSLYLFYHLLLGIHLRFAFHYLRPSPGVPSYPLFYYRSSAHRTNVALQHTINPPRNPGRIRDDLRRFSFAFWRCTEGEWGRFVRGWERWVFLCWLVSGWNSFHFFILFVFIFISGSGVSSSASHSSIAAGLFVFILFYIYFFVPVRTLLWPLYNSIQFGPVLCSISIARLFICCIIPIITVLTIIIISLNSRFCSSNMWRGRTPSQNLSSFFSRPWLFRSYFLTNRFPFRSLWGCAFVLHGSLSPWPRTLTQSRNMTNPSFVRSFFFAFVFIIFAFLLNFNPILCSLLLLFLIYSHSFLSSD